MKFPEHSKIANFRCTKHEALETLFQGVKIQRILTVFEYDKNIENIFGGE
ncbi:hypothetical protein [Methanobacterium sp.]|jgi:hypothetical protein